MKQLSILFLVILLSSCGKSDEEIQKENKEKDKVESTERENKEHSVIEGFQKKYHCVSGWDTTEHYTFQLQELFIEQNNPIDFEGSIKDIIKRDSNYYLICYNRFGFDHVNYIAEISITKEMFNDFRTQLGAKYSHYNAGHFIFKVRSITSAPPRRGKDENDKIEDELRYNIDSEIQPCFLIFKGEMIDYHLN